MGSQFSIRNATRGKTPRVDFASLKQAVLGAQYELSLAFVTPKTAREVTKKTKHVDKASNVLAFPLGKRSGEILICTSTAKRESKQWHATPDAFIAYLFIHGMLHLKCLDHGVTMERSEQRLVKRFTIDIDLS